MVSVFRSLNCVDHKVKDISSYRAHWPHLKNPCRIPGLKQQTANDSLAVWVNSWMVRRF